jgi:hypothetical protein
MKRCLFHIAPALLLLFSSSLSAQNWLNTGMNESTRLMLQKRQLSDSSAGHTSINHLYLNPADSLAQKFSQYKLEKENLYFSFYPSFYISAGMLQEKEFSSNNSIGFNTDLAYKAGNHQVALHAGAEMFAGVQPYYLRLRMQQRQIIPGYTAQSRINRHWNIGWMPDVYLHYQSPWVLSLETGMGKHVVGDGYRSLLLSDNSSTYPYASLYADVDNILYRINWMWLNNSTYQTFDPEPGKFALMHYLSWNIHKRVSLGLFESVVWTKEQRGGFEAQYLNPFIFFRPVEFSLGSSDNALLGLNISYNPFGKCVLYGQFILDDLKVGELAMDIRHRLNPDDDSFDYGWFANKYGGQFGIKLYDAFGLNGLFVQAEANAVRPFVYAHNNISQTYTHQYQSLAHPLGANFVEMLGHINYQFSMYRLSFTGFYAIQGESPTGTSMGENIFYPVSDGPNMGYIPASTYGNEILQGIKCRWIYLESEFSWLAAPQGSLEIFARAFYRKSGSETLTTFTNYGIMLGARTHPSQLSRYF